MTNVIKTIPCQIKNLQVGDFYVVSSDMPAEYQDHHFRVVREVVPITESRYVILLDGGTYRKAHAHTWVDIKKVDPVLSHMTFDPMEMAYLREALVALSHAYGAAQGVPEKITNLQNRFDT